VGQGNPSIEVGNQTFNGYQACYSDKYGFEVSLVLPFLFNLFDKARFFSPYTELLIVSQLRLVDISAKFKYNP